MFSSLPQILSRENIINAQRKNCQSRLTHFRSKTLSPNFFSYEDNHAPRLNEIVQWKYLLHNKMLNVHGISFQDHVLKTIDEAPINVHDAGYLQRIFDMFFQNKF